MKNSHSSQKIKYSFFSYIGIICLFYLGIQIVTVISIIFFPTVHAANVDPYARIIGVVAWLLITPKLLKPNEEFLNPKSWNFSKKNLCFGILGGLITLTVSLGFAALTMDENSKAIDRSAMAPSALIVLFLVNSFLTPFCEEIMWRGVF